MGKNKKGYNWRARSQLPGNVDLSQARVLEGKVLDKGDIRSKAGGYGAYEVGFVVLKPTPWSTLSPSGQQCSGYASGG